MSLAISFIIANVCTPSAARTMAATGCTTKCRHTNGNARVKTTRMRVIAWYHRNGNCVSFSFLHARLTLTPAVVTWLAQPG
jgi:hypothetical protein